MTVSFTWPGPDVDVLRLFVEPTPMPWGVDPVDEDIAVFRVLDERERETKRVAGIEIVGFLRFDCGDDLPTLPTLWRLPGEEPRALADFLRSLQAELRAESGQSSDRAAALTPTTPAS